MELSKINKNESVFKSSKNASFKLTELKMDVKEGILTIRIKAPLLKPNNFAIDIANGILTLKVMLAKIETSYGVFKKKPVFVESFLVLPNSCFNTLINTQYVDGGLYISVAEKNTTSLLSDEVLAGVA